jgi:raffinose/stachyose/melibiose transport system permease protein
MFGMLIPEHSLLVPLFIMYKNIGFLDKVYSLIIPYIAFGLPMSIFLIESYVRMVPRELEEAAHVDGSSFVYTMFSIIMPICKPVISTALILAFLDKWNEFSFALVLIRSDRFKTIPIGLTNFFGVHTTDYTQFMAALVIASLPVIIIYAIFNKSIIKGMVAGAVKG